MLLLQIVLVVTTLNQDKKFLVVALATGIDE
jgi:hypothetical protein